MPFISPLNLSQASQAAPNEQNDFSVNIRYWEGETADSSASPDFLLNLVALANFMRLSLLKGAHARCPVLRGRKSGFARNDKGEGGALLEFGGPSNYPRDVVHFSLYFPQASRGLGVTKGSRTLSFGLMVVMTNSQMLFIPDSTCRRQVRLLLMTQGGGFGVGNNPTQANRRRLEWATHSLAGWGWASCLPEAFF
jgi:hypothetical protein